jgi:hypothetical protein
MDGFVETWTDMDRHGRICRVVTDTRAHMDRHGQTWTDTDRHDGAPFLHFVFESLPLTPSHAEGFDEIDFGDLGQIAH